MKRRRTPGVVFAYEGLTSIPEASDKKLTSRLEKRRIVLQTSGPQILVRIKILDRG